jgi:hypothetical protein
MYKKNVTVEKTEGTIKNGKSRDTSIIEHTRQIWNSWRRKAPHWHKWLAHLDLSRKIISSIHVRRGKSNSKI